MTPEQDPWFNEQLERGLVDALQFVVQHLEGWPDLDAALEIHRLLFQTANSGMAGRYRRDNVWPNYVDFAPIRWTEVPVAMLRFDELQAQMRLACDAVEAERQALEVIRWSALLHLRFESIHPFEDGNGRTGRALVQWWLNHYGIPALVVHEGNRDAYLDALHASDRAFSHQDLAHADVWPIHWNAVEPLIEFFLDHVGVDPEG